MKEETKEKLRQANLGKKHSEETKKKMSDAKKGKPFSGTKADWNGKHHTQESKNKISKSKTGKKTKPCSDERKQKIGNANRGRVYSEEYLESIRGENSHKWQGGKSFEIYPQEWTDDLRDCIRKRDGYMCQICGLHQDEITGFIKKLHVHHIDYNKENCDPKNLITLCISCHMKTNYNREHWLEYFTQSFK